MKTQDIKLLNEIEEGKSVKILNMVGGMGVRQHLSTIGIHIGDIVFVKRRSLWRGPILIEVHGSEVALGKGVASKIQVEEI